MTAAIVLDPGSVTISASPRLSIVTARRRRSSSIRRCAVARSSPIALNAPPRSWSSRGPDGSHAALELALGEAVGRVDQLVERAAHRADERGDQRERAGQREHPGDDDQHERPARIGAGLLAGGGLTRQLVRLELGGERAGVRERAADRGGGREPAGQGETPGLVLGRDLGADEPLARGVIPRELRRGRGGRPVVGGDLAAGAGALGAARVAQYLLLGDPGAREVGAGGGERGRPLELVLVALARAVEACDAERGHDGERERQGDERQAQRAGDGKMLHRCTIGAAGNPGVIVPAVPAFQPS